MNEEDKIHINSFKFYDRDELEELTNQYYLENKRLKEQLQQKENIINKAKEYINEYTTKYNIGEERYIDEFDRFASPNKLLEILDNKGE